MSGYEPHTNEWKDVEKSIDLSLLFLFTKPLSSLPLSLSLSLSLLVLQTHSHISIIGLSSPFIHNKW
jgi:hypothetical protein